VFVAADAGGSPTAFGDQLALDRMARNGVVTVGTNQVMAELAGDWTSNDGQAVIEVIGKYMKR